jgi:hypothetical protein
VIQWNCKNIRVIRDLNGNTRFFPSSSTTTTTTTTTDDDDDDDESTTTTDDDENSTTTTTTTTTDDDDDDESTTTTDDDDDDTTTTDGSLGLNHITNTCFPTDKELLHKNLQTSKDISRSGENIKPTAHCQQVLFMLCAWVGGGGGGGESSLPY